jgi:hypothetical protein
MPSWKATLIALAVALASTDLTVGHGLQLIERSDCQDFRRAPARGPTHGHLRTWRWLRTTG